MSYALTLTAVVALPVAAALGWWKLTRGFVDGRAETALVTGIWVVFQFSGGLAALGWLGLLSASTAMATQAALTIVVWVVATRRRLSLDRPSPTDAEDGRPARTGRGDSFSPVLRWIAVAGVVIAGLLIARMVWYAVLLPIDSSDGSTYHLPALIEALRNGRFSRPPSVWTFGWTSPKAADMAFLWLLLTNKLDLVLFGQILFLPLAVAATASLAVWASVQRSTAWFFGGMVVFVPIVVVQATTAYVDVASGALFLAAIAAAVLYRSGRLRSTFAVLTVFAAVGLAAGAKYSFLIPAAILLAVAFWPDLRQWNLTRAHAAGVGVLLIGSHWYLAPIIWYGNPTWPYAMPFLADLFPQYLDTVDNVVARELAFIPALEQLPALLRPPSVWIEPGPHYQTYSLDSRTSGLGPLWFVIWLPAILAWAVIWIREGRRRDIVMIAGIFAISFFIQTYTWWTRFTWWIVALGIVATAVVFERSSTWLRAAIAAVVVLGGVYVLAFTNVQATWAAPTMSRLVSGEDPVAVSSGDVVAYAHHMEDEVIAVPGLAWGSWNTYVLGADFSNRLVIVPPGDDFAQRIRESQATVLFDPGHDIIWSSEHLSSLGPCLETLISDNERNQSLHRISCP